MSRAYPLMSAERIATILSEETGCGSFSQKVELEDGRTLVHQFSFATAMGAQHDRSCYRTFFHKSPPDWLDDIHPYHARCLCREAIKLRNIVPRKFRWQDHVGS